MSISSPIGSILTLNMLNAAAKQIVQNSVYNPELHLMPGGGKKRPIHILPGSTEICQDATDSNVVALAL